jgi:hypothetical protein
VGRSRCTYDQGHHDLPAGEGRRDARAIAEKSSLANTGGAGFEVLSQALNSYLDVSSADERVALWTGGQSDASGSAGIWLTRVALSLAASDRVLLAKSAKSD